jgi:signal transduction histidine kinase/ActR/RegA family two-component response regulator
MDGTRPDDLYLVERRRRLAAERTLERTRTELSRVHDALVANADRLSLRYLSERATNVQLTDRQERMLAQREEAADRADRARRRLWHALEAMRDGFALFDPEGRLVAANSGYLHLFDASSELGPGSTYAELLCMAAEEGAFVLEDDLDPDDWVAAELARRAEGGETSRVLRTFDGRTIRFHDRRAPDGDVVCLAVDISAEQEREQELARARDAAEATARAKQDFLARMSHEIRTPMNGILGLSEMLLDGPTDTEALSYARTIRDSSEALLTIVNDTLDVSRLEAGHVDIRMDAFDLEAMLCDCARLAEMARPDATVPVLLDYPLAAPTRVLGDEGRMRQIVNNILGNASKFTDAGHILLRVSLTRGKDDLSCRIEVRDTGPGIPSADRERIFDAFAQVEGERPLREGTGLGLTISRGLAERMGGTLVAEDPEGGGARLALTLPLAAAQDWPAPPVIPPVTVPEGLGVAADVLAEKLRAAGAEVIRGAGPGVRVVPIRTGGEAIAPEDCAGAVVIARADRLPDPIRAAAAVVLAPPVPAALLLETIASIRPPQPAKRDRAAPREVLIADDNQTNRFLLEKMLAPTGWGLRSAFDGAEAVKLYAERRPDVVLMDISMPEMDGFEALAAIRAAEAEAGRQAAAVIALTAHTGDEMAARLEAAGFASHQTKPVRKALLLEAIEAALADRAERAVPKSPDPGMAFTSTRPRSPP